VKPSFEIFDHTADAGIRVFAPTLPELLAPAGDGLYAVIGEIVPGDSTESVDFDLKGSEASILLRDYLNELLILFEQNLLRVDDLNVETFNDRRLVVSAQASSIDRHRSHFHREVKAITYHELDIRTIPGGYEATVIVDI
jgi:SHS2 domain-containing protein